MTRGCSFTSDKERNTLRTIQVLLYLIVCAASSFKLWFSCSLRKNKKFKGTETNKQTNKTKDLTESFLWREQIFSQTYPYSYLTSVFTLFSRLKELCRGDPAVFRNAYDQRVWPQHCHRGEGIICLRSHFSFLLCSSHTDSSTKCST